MCAECHLDPALFTRCCTCACVRTITTYQRVGWLKKLESEAAQLRQQLDDLPTGE